MSVRGQRVNLYKKAALLEYGIPPNVSRTGLLALDAVDVHPRGRRVRVDLEHGALLRLDGPPRRKASNPRASKIISTPPMMCTYTRNVSNGTLLE